MPLRADLDVAVVRLARVVHDAPHAAVLVRGERVAKLPEGVALEIEACWRKTGYAVRKEDFLKTEQVG